jgi:hypothetical protein
MLNTLIVGRAALAIPPAPRPGEPRHAWRLLRHVRRLLARLRR